MENLTSASDPRLNVLKQQLTQAGIDILEWGKGQAKTLEHLQKEIDDGETTLTIGKEGVLLRTVVVGGVDIYYISPECKRYRLKEDKQIFKDGRERRRKMDQSVSEKMKPDESPAEAMVRGIKEELGLDGELSLTQAGSDERLVTSPSYPGLQSKYIRYAFETTLSENQFKPDGYIENQPDKSTYFIWEEIA